MADNASDHGASMLAQRDALLAAAKRLDQFQATYRRCTGDDMPGNGFYSALLMQVVDAARAAIALTEAK